MCVYGLCFLFFPLAEPERSSLGSQTPTWNARPAVDAAIDACRRGVEVILYIGLGFNDKGESVRTRRVWLVAFEATSCSQSTSVPPPDPFPGRNERGGRRKDVQHPPQRGQGGSPQVLLVCREGPEQTPQRRT